VGCSQRYPDGQVVLKKSISDWDSEILEDSDKKSYEKKPQCIDCRF